MTGINYWSVRNIWDAAKQDKKSATSINEEIFIRETWKKPLHECQPREIFDYLRSIGYKGELEYTMKIKI